MFREFYYQIQKFRNSEIQKFRNSAKIVKDLFSDQKTSFRRWTTILVFGLVVFSCKKKHDVSPTETTEKESYASNTEMTQLLKKLENPYSVSNMKKAYESLRKSNTRAISDDVEILATHFYVKFKPKNNQELEILKDDTTLTLYSYPLDYEISQGTYYHDPSIPDSLPTFQYCSVPVNQNLPTGVDYEILENLYIPDENRDGATANQRTISDETTEALVTESLRLTGNLKTEEDTKNARTTCWYCPPPSWRPAGRIRVWDDVNNTWRGVEGVIVKARRWFTTYEGTSNVNGNYSCNGTFQREVNYSLDWERYHFALREGWLDGANINGPKKGGNWDCDFKGDKHAFHAKVFMGAYHYYYKDIKGLRRPPLNGFLKTQMKIRCFNEENSGSNGNHNPARRFLGLGSAIQIYNPSRAIQEIYGTVTHELAHASHWNMSSVYDYHNCEDKVAESWARGVQWELTRMIWSSYRGGDYSPVYTLVVLDMIDKALDDSNNGKYTLSEDNVMGYTIRQIEDALIGQRTWNGWRDNIKNKYNNATENNLDALFSAWN